MERRIGRRFERKTTHHTGQLGRDLKSAISEAKNKGILVTREKGKEIAPTLVEEWASYRLTAEKKNGQVFYHIHIRRKNPKGIEEIDTTWKRDSSSENLDFTRGFRTNYSAGDSQIGRWVSQPFSPRLLQQNLAAVRNYRKLLKKREEQAYEED